MSTRTSSRTKVTIDAAGARAGEGKACPLAAEARARRRHDKIAAHRPSDSRTSTADTTTTTTADTKTSPASSWRPCSAARSRRSAASSAAAAPPSSASRLRPARESRSIHEPCASTSRDTRETSEKPFASSPWSRKRASADPWRGCRAPGRRVPSSDRKASAYAPSPRRRAAGWRCKRSTIETTKTLAGASASSAGRPPRSPPPRARSGRSWRWTAKTVSTDRDGARCVAGLTKRRITRISTLPGTTAEVGAACVTGITTRGRCGTRLYRSDTTRMGGAGRPGTGA
mmetsp:Transcript_85/g.398  ORF Transcript_85/g.398 Transcript_85/m.398 type:complete len:286 (+) Transcript_85:264-1121(+)